jgi:hypothetical protein
LAGDVLETVLYKVLAFVEKSWTVQTNNTMSEDRKRKLHSMVVPPPDRTKEMKAIENEIYKKDRNGDRKVSAKGQYSTKKLRDKEKFEKNQT